jgi:alpha-amylase/alpha-mannosidase (GH57 family)
MKYIRLALLWHQHQPYYRDLRTGVFRMPWVRLHGTKDYWGMARLLADAGPRVKATINLVPSLVEQIEAYADGHAADEHLSLSMKLPGELTREERERILDIFFMAHVDRMIRPHPRYFELFRKRRADRFAAHSMVDEFDEEELRDLQVWANLSWFHGLLLAEDPGLSALVKKDRSFTEEDKLSLFARQQEVLADLLPMHRKLVETGRIEVTTSPYYHPILPLLADMDSARVALPGTPLPRRRKSLATDAREQLDRAVRKMTSVIGRAPTGLWPSEGSVSPEMLPLVSGAGFSWLASDGDVLAASRGSADYRPGDLYEPWRLETEHGDLAIVFRDHRLSDLVGFDYQGMDEAAAARDLVHRIRVIGGQYPGGEPLVTLILDGENPWEYYPRGGVEFLRTFYAELQAARDIETVTLTDHLERHPPTRTLNRLHSGSWIHANFAIWIGHEDDVRAWKYLFRVREDLVRFGEADGDGIPPEDLARAWECLYIAEGSDWTWWYGDDHSSGQDDEFDSLFRTHLKNVYFYLGRTPPGFLDRPVPRREDREVDEPGAFLDIRIDGKRTSYFEWLAAGRYLASEGEGLSSEGGAMHRAGEAVMTGLNYGFDAETFFLRIDLADGWRSLVAARQEEPISLRICFDHPGQVTIDVVSDDGRNARATVRGPEGVRGPAEFAVDDIVELGCPFALLGVKPGEPVSFHVEMRYGEVLAERLPGAETVSFDVPTENFEAEHWRV